MHGKLKFVFLLWRDGEEGRKEKVKNKEEEREEEGSRVLFPCSRVVENQTQRVCVSSLLSLLFSTIFLYLFLSLDLPRFPPSPGSRNPFISRSRFRGSLSFFFPLSSLILLLHLPTVSLPLLSFSPPSLP